MVHELNRAYDRKRTRLIDLLPRLKRQITRIKEWLEASEQLQQEDLRTAYELRKGMTGKKEPALDEECACTDGASYGRVQEIARANGVPTNQTKDTLCRELGAVGLGWDADGNITRYSDGQAEADALYEKARIAETVHATVPELNRDMVGIVEGFIAVDPHRSSRTTTEYPINRRRGAWRRE